MKAETVDLTLIEDPSALDQHVPEIEVVESGTVAEPSVNQQEQRTESQPQHEVTTLKSEVDLLKQRVAELERENLQLFRRDLLKTKYIKLLEKHQQWWLQLSQSTETFFCARINSFRNFETLSTGSDWKTWSTAPINCGQHLTFCYLRFDHQHFTRRAPYPYCIVWYWTE